MRTPFLVDIEITTLCNLRCKHCYNHSGEKGMNMDLELVKNLMLKLKKLNICIFDIIGGEPFLYPYIFEMLEFAKRIDLNTMVNTNGTLITKEIIKKLKEANPFVKVGVSLDGSDPEINDLIRGNGNYKKTIDGINRLIENSFDVVLLFVVNKLNWKDFEDYINLAKKLGVNKIYVDRFIPVGRGKINEEKLDMNVKEWKTVLRFINEKINHYSKEIDFIVEDSISGKECSAGKNQISILIDGNVVPCGHFRYNKEFYLGNIFEEEIEKILLRIEENKFINYSPPECFICEKNCKGGCKFYSFLFWNGLNKPDPVICNYTVSPLKICL
ncbi:MAG: radical SAM protein [Candidatus Omnitrophica bacterium]|nr:radical SAM protein [Candidatus Omnitrophota bacterium]